jgi:hypothetical protein
VTRLDHSILRAGRPHRHVALRYLGAVAAATAIFVAAEFAWRFSVADHPLEEVLIVALFTAVVIGFCASVTALLPFLAVKRIAAPSMPAMDPDLEPTLWQAMMAIGPFLLPSGLVGGVTYWGISVRRS